MFDEELLRLDGMKGAMAALIVASLAQAALVFGQALSLSIAIAHLWAGESLESQFGYMLGFFGCFSLRYAVRFVQAELLDRYACKRSESLHKRLLAIAFDGKALLAGFIGTGAAITAMTESVNEITRYINTVPPRLCGILGVSVPLLAALFSTDWISGVIALATLPVIALFMIMLGRQARDRARRQFSASQRLSNHFVDSMRGIETIASLGAGEQAGADVHESSEKLRVATMRTLSVAMLSSAVLDLITVFGVAGIAMMLAFRLLDGSIELNTALLALMLAPDFFAPIRSFASEFHASLDGKNALGSVLAILDKGEADRDEPLREGHPPTAEDSNRKARRSLSPWDANSSLELHDVRYDYPDETEVGAFNCTMRGFESVAIVGASGAGKSTLVDLIAGFKAPSSGTVSIDGKPCNDLDAHGWSRQLHYIPQNPYVFRMTLLDNMRFYSPNATREQVEHVVELVGLDELVSSLPDGLDTLIGDAGRGLSGGESHRVALARMLLDDRPILLFDEPTAHLDIETELELKQRMLPLFEGKLVILATHRLHWLGDVDRIIVVENGTVAETGTLEELTAHDGAFLRFVESERGEAVA